MRRSCLLICLALPTTFGDAGRAHASPLKLSIIGSVFDKPIDETIDVSHGFSGATLPLTDFPIGAVYGSIPEGGGKSIDSSIFLQATVFDSSRNLATLTLGGPIHGGLIHHVGSPNIDGSVEGEAVHGSLYVLPGLDPGEIPSWFPGLSVSVSGDVTGGGYNFLQSNLSISPGATPTQHVPEPTSLAVFLLSAGAGLGLRRSRRA